MSEEKKWDCAVGIVKVDGLRPSKEMQEMIEKEKKGEMTMDEIEEALYKKYGIRS